MPHRVRTAELLLEALDEILAALTAYDLDERREYTKRMAAALSPLVAQLRSAVRAGAERRHLTRLTVPITELIRSIGAATTKGEIPVFGDESPDADRHPLNRYWDLYTMFRETEAEE